MELNDDHLDELNIKNEHYRTQLSDEIALLRMRSEYEFFKRLKSPSTRYL